MKASSPPMVASSICSRRRWRHGAGAFILALAMVLVIALLQRWGLAAGLDRALMQAAGRIRASAAGQLITVPMLAASMAGGTAGRLILLGLAVGLLLAWRRGRDAVWLGVTALGGMLLNIGLKQVFASPRPDLLLHLDIVHSYSFPSGHAAGNLILFGALAMVIARRDAWVTGVSLIGLIGVSRVWLGVHWPSDVIAGWIEGVGWLLLCRVWRSKSQDAAG